MFYCSLENFVKVKLLTGTAEGEGLVVLKAYHFFLGLIWFRAAEYINMIDA